MAPIPPPDLDAPFRNVRIVQLRTSKMQIMRELTIETGIYKQPRSGRVWCSTTGLESDEHDLTFHGGRDKAVHQYYPGHYPVWRDENTDNDSFQIGGFGENLVCEGGMNERNVCIGDIYRVGDDGDGVVLQVSLPRQPCFKLNHRFGIKGFAPQTWKKSRTGWYYRVLKEGWMGEGDEMVLMERKHPKWTIERIQEYLHRDKNNLAMAKELGSIEEFGDECKGAFQRIIDSLKKGEEKKTKEIWVDYEVVEKKAQTDRITSITFQQVGTEGEGEEIDPGCFVRLKLPNGLLRSYSIVSGGSARFQLGVALDDESRGGSSCLHKEVKVGDKIPVGKIRESVPIHGECSNHIFLAGGIGITAFLSHIAIYQQINFNYTLHYAVRSTADIPFPELIKKMGKNVQVYDRSLGQRMDIRGILSNRLWNSYVYACGPQRMMDDAVRAATALGMGQDEIHYEAFQADGTGDPFTVELRQSKRVLNVVAEKTLLETLREAGLDVDSSCETGVCGTCRVEVCAGKVEHRGSGLGSEDKEGAMLSCVSRGVGHIVVDF